MDTEKMIRLIFVLVCCFQFISETSSGPMTYTSCKSADQCVLLKDCKSYMVFINSLEKPLKPPVVDFLREKQCGFHEGYPKVCCSDSSKDNVATKSNYKTCNVKNECVALKNCKPFMDLINKMKKPLNPEFVKFLRDQQCGFKEGYPTVCCSSPPETIKALSRRNPKPEDRNKRYMDFDLQNKVKTNTKSSNWGTKRNIKNKADAINQDISDFFALPALFDLLRRRRRSSSGTEGIKIA